MKSTLLTCLVLTLALSGHGADASDAATHDPATVDLQYPPTMESLRIPTVGGAQLNAIIYRAGGAGLHPVVVMFHGYPGNEKNLDLAQALRRGGYHVVWFNYRGSWGGGGVFTMSNCLEDARQVLAFVRSAPAVEKYGFDASRIAVAGHSLGGWVALLTAAHDPAIQTVVSLAAWNPVVDLNRFEGDPAQHAIWVAGLDADFDAQAGPLRGAGGVGVTGEIARERVAFDYFNQAPALATKSLLVIAATRDTDQPLPQYHDPLIKALTAAKATHLEILLYEDDHPFSAHRIALAQKVVTWLQQFLPPKPR
jgi:pimeloyl-ACP methyl ester carboxylesterase